MFETLVNNPEQITFPILFVGLLIYVMKTNDNREKQYRSTIDENNKTINHMTKALGALEDVEHKLDVINSRIAESKKEVS